MSEQSIYNNQILEIYSQLWRYKDVLKGAPAFKVDPTQVTEETEKVLMPQIDFNTKEIIGYLLGIQVKEISTTSMIAAIEKHYQKDDFWRKLLIEYVQAIHNKDISAFQEEKQKLEQQLLSFKNKINSYSEERKEIILSFAAAIEKEKFPVNAQKLLSNYLNMADENPQEAWSVLVTNPAYFSPIITTDSQGKNILSPAEAKKQNEKLAKFLKNLKA